MPSFRVYHLRTAFLRAFQYLYIGSQYGYQDDNAIYGSSPPFHVLVMGAKFHGESACMAQSFICGTESFNHSFSKETANISRRYHDFLCILL